MIKKYCCLPFENAILKGSIREEIIVEGAPEHDVYIAEFVTSKTIKKKLFFLKEERINTKEIMLKHCIYCWQPLSGFVYQ